MSTDVIIHIGGEDVMNGNGIYITVFHQASFIPIATLIWN